MSPKHTEPNDACIHGPGVANCGHPDCVGERDYAAGRLFDVGWLEEQVEKCVASMNSLPPGIRASLRQPGESS